MKSFSLDIAAIKKDIDTKRRIEARIREERIKDTIKTLHESFVESNGRTISVDIDLASTILSANIKGIFVYYLGVVDDIGTKIPVTDYILANMRYGRVELELRADLVEEI